MKHYSLYATLKIIIQVQLERIILLFQESPDTSKMKITCQIFLGEVGHCDLNQPHSVKVQGQSWASRLCGSVGIFSDLQHSSCLQTTSAGLQLFLIYIQLSFAFCGGVIS